MTNFFYDNLQVNKWKIGVFQANHKRGNFNVYNFNNNSNSNNSNLAVTIPRGGSCGSLFADRIGMWNFSFCVFVGLNNTVLPILVKCFVQVTNLYSHWEPVLPLFIMVCFLFVFVLFFFVFCSLFLFIYFFFTVTA